MVRLLSLAIGLVVTLIACGITLYVFPQPWNYAAALVALLYVGGLGINKVEIGFVGVPTIFFGRLAFEVGEDMPLPDGTTQEVVVREAPFVAPEGLSWLLPPPFMGAVGVDMREQSTEIPAFTVITGGAAATAAAPQPARRISVGMRIGSSVIRWRISNPAQSLQIGEGVIRTSLVELVQQHLRIRIRSFASDREAIDAWEQVRNEIQQAADVRAAMWGVDVIEVLLGEVLPPAEILRAYETERELESVRSRIAETMQVGGQQLSAQEARDLVQVQTGKSARNIHTIDLGGGFRELLVDLIAALRGGGRP